MREEREALSGPAGMAALFEAHHRDLERFLRARCGDPEAAQDLMQELWLKLSRTPTGPIANGRAYLFRMANNLMLDTVRGQRRAMARDRAWIEAGGPTGTTPEDRPDPSQPADEALAAAQEAALLHRAIEALPPGARRALWLHRFEDKRQAEVAEIMGISVSGVEKHLAVAMRHLRNALADCGVFAAAASKQHEPPRDSDARRNERP